MGHASCKGASEPCAPCSTASGCEQVSHTIFPCSTSSPTLPNGLPAHTELFALSDRTGARIGALANDKPVTEDTQGKVQLAGGATYEGSWLGEHKHGQGTLVLPDGMRYCGQFQYDQKKWLWYLFLSKWLHIQWSVGR